MYTYVLHMNNFTQEDTYSCIFVRNMDKIQTSIVV